MISENDKLKQEIWSSFNEQQHIFIATAEGDQPRLRPVTLIRLQNRLYVATGANDAKIKQIKQNPKTELCLMLEKEGQHGTIRAECIAKIVADANTKAKIYNKIPFLKEFWKSPEDPGYTLVELQPKSFEYMPPGSIQSVKIKL